MVGSEAPGDSKQHSQNCLILHGQVLVVLGLINHFLGYLDLSLENFQSALEIFFENSGVNSEYTGSVTSNIAVIFFQIGDYSQSLEFQKSALTILKNLTVLTKKLQNSEKNAPSSPDTSKGKHPVIPIAYYNLGLIYLKMGSNQQALEHLKKAIESFIA